MKKLFDTEDKVKEAISELESLTTTRGWEILCSVWDESIKMLLVQLEEGVSDETKEDINIIRNRLRLLRDIKNTPGDIIEGLQDDIESTPELDPFE